MNQIKIECVLLPQDAVALVRADDIDQAVKSFLVSQFSHELYFSSTICPVESANHFKKLSNKKTFQ